MEGLPLHPLKEQRESVYDWRQIGLGTMGLGDMLIKMGIVYGSQECITFLDTVYKALATHAVLSSLELAKVKEAYPACNKELLSKSSFINSIGLPTETIKEVAKYGLYNSQLLTCAPTGTTSTMISTSGGVEPNFAFSFNRRTVSLNNEETTYKVDTQIVKDYRNATGNEKELPNYFIASHEIPYKQRIEVQAVIQRYIDASISSTVNLPESTTIEEVADLYMHAWECGLKGVTIWRDNCQRQGILTTTETKPVTTELKRGEVVKANDDCIGLKRTLTTGCGTLHCEGFFDPVTGELRETYLNKGSKGGCNNFMIGLSRMISLSARGGIGLDKILDQLRSCGTCPSYAVRTATKKDTSTGSCCPIAVGNALKSMHEEVLQRINHCCPEEPSKMEVTKVDNVEYSECPECHQKTLVHNGGCTECISCGYSKCN